MGRLFCTRRGCLASSSASSDEGVQPAITAVPAASATLTADRLVGEQPQALAPAVRLINTITAQVWQLRPAMKGQRLLHAYSIKSAGNKSFFVEQRCMDS